MFVQRGRTETPTRNHVARMNRDNFKTFQFAGKSYFWYQNEHGKLEAHPVEGSSYGVVLKAFA
jgi:hypothetical protein